MSNPGQNNSEITSLSDEHIRDLKPENQRYDITLAQDFVISVLPNGVKTWAFIYDFQGRNRRRTLGVFPDMTFPEAKAALAKARNMMVRMDEPTVPPDELGQRPAVLSGGRYVPKTEPTESRTFLWVLVSLVVVGGLAAGAWLYWHNLRADDTEVKFSIDTSRPFATTPVSPPATGTGTGKPGAPASSDLPAVAPPESGPEPDDTIATVTSPPAEINPSAAAPDPSPVTTGDLPVTSSAPPPVPATTDRSEPQTPDPSVQTATDSLSPATTDPPIPPTDNTSSPGPGETASTAPTQTAATSAPASDRDPAARTLAPAADATAYGGKVTRSSLTSRVVNLEPDGVIGPEISYQNSGFTRVFYFTELRDFSEGYVVHRWELNGNVIEEVKLKVKKSWRWRTYSNKDLTPGLTGEWTVMTIDASGSVLDTEKFTYGY